MSYPWSSALVTGASSGIGEAFARELAAAGADLILVARRVDLLESLAGELRNTGSTVEVLPADLADSEAIGVIEARLTDTFRPVDLLINCAGIGASGPFAQGELTHYRNVIELNVNALVSLTHAAVIPMTHRRKGWIINVSSLGGHTPGPGFAVYSATKAFVTSFSESLFEELRPSRVVVTAACPGATHTAFGEEAGADGSDLPSMLWQEPREVAVEALAACAAGRAVRVTGRINRVTAALSTVMPRSVNRKIAGMVTDRL